MAAFFKALRRSERGQEVLSQMEQQCHAFERLMQRAEGAAQSLQNLTQPLTEIEQAVSSLRTRLGQAEAQLKTVERIAPQFEKLDGKAEVLAKGQRRSETELNHAQERIEKIQADIAELVHRVDMATGFKDDLGELLEMGGPLKELRHQAADLTEQMSGLREGFETVTGQQEAFQRGYQEAEARLDTFDQRYQQIADGVGAAQEALGKLSREMAGLSKVASGTADTKRQLATLKALTDSVGQKMAAIEQQREAVERATREASNLSELVRKIDIQVRNHAEKAKAIDDLRMSVENLTALHTKVLEQSDEITAHQQQVERADRETRDRLAALESDVGKSVERLELEREGLDAVSQRVVDLRRELTACEDQFHALSDSTGRFADLQSQAHGLEARVDAMAQELNQLEEEAQRVRSLRTDVDRLDSVVDQVTARVHQIEEAQPGVEHALNDLAALSRSHEAVKDALEQLAATEAEVTRAREGQAATASWLATTQDALSGLQIRVKELHAMRPTVEMVRSEVERVTDSLKSIEGRRTAVEDLQKRMVDILALGSQLDERSKGLVSRMESAEERFAVLAKRADEAGRVEKLVAQVSTDIEQSGRRAGAIEEAVTKLEDRSQNLESLSDRVRTLGQELDQRQSALERSAEHLERASTLRQEAAASVQELNDQSRRLTAAILAAEGRTKQLVSLADELDDRSTNLRFTEKRLAQFEEKLAKWETTENRVAQALEQAMEREATIHALQGEFRHLLDMADRTMQDVRSISAAQQEIAQTRALLENALGQVRDVHEAADDLHNRQQQLRHAEDRLARAEALLIDIQTGLETLQGQKAFLDHVIDKAGSLTFQTKQAEALIATLREERDLTNKVRSAVASSRQQKAG